MIPKIAWFHWAGDGPPLSWLRLVSIASFARLNPDWEIHIIRSAPEIRRRGFDYAHEADYTWWVTLLERGGLQVATDIVFTKPIPEEWTQASLAAVSERGTVVSFPVLGCERGHPYMARVVERCRALAEAGPGEYDYQLFGCTLLRSLGDCGEHFAIPMEALCPIMWNDTGRLWNRSDQPDIAIAESTIGVHWFGGCDLAKQYERETTWASSSPIARLAGKEMA